MIHRLFGILVVSMACTLPTSVYADADDLPSIEIVFRGLLERSCSYMTDQPINQEAMDELDSRLGEFIQAWEDIGPALMKETVAITGVPFAVKERMVALHICDGVPSMSAPLIVKSNFYLKSIYAEDAWPVSRFAINFLYHELLHNYIAAAFTEEILEEYKDLSPVTMHHLHLMAIEQVVLTNLGLTEALEFSYEFYESKPPYKIGLDLVKERGAAYFLDQLRKHPLTR